MKWMYEESPAKSRYDAGRLVELVNALGLLFQVRDDYINLISKNVSLLRVASITLAMAAFSSPFTSAVP